MAVWNIVSAEIGSFSPDDLLYDRTGKRAFDKVKEYDVEEHPDARAIFQENFGYGMSSYRWTFCIVRRFSKFGTHIDEKRYVAAQLWPTAEELAELYEPNCRCGYCTSPWLSLDWLWWTRKDHGCIKDGTGWAVTRVRERTRDYIVREYGQAVL